MSEMESQKSWKHETWSSRTTFLFAAVGAAVGLGNLWRFPYVAGENGGGAFILLYIAFVFLLGLPIMAAEMVIGRRGHNSAVTSMNNLVKTERLSPVWRTIGWLSLVIPFVGLSYYSVVAGWVMDYVWVAFAESFKAFGSDSSATIFASRTGDTTRQVIMHALFIALTVAIVRRGVNRGIEMASKIMMPGLFILLIGLVIYNATALEVGSTLSFLFTPDFSRLTTESVLMALGQAFFSIAIGVGVMMTYSAYLPRNVSLPKSAATICAADTFVALLGGLAIFPIVFFYGLDAGAGPGLIFVTLPVAFGQMPGGHIVGTLFFLLLFFAAFTTAIGMLEPMVSWLEERTSHDRGRMTIAAGVVAWAIGLPSVLSFNAWSDFHPLGWFEKLSGMTSFDILDFLIANFLLPLNALLIALFVGWALSEKASVEELGIGRGLRYQGWRSIVRFLVPVAIVGIIIDLWF